MGRLLLLARYGREGREEGLGLKQNNRVGGMKGNGTMTYKVLYKAHPTKKLCKIPQMSSMRCMGHLLTVSQPREERGGD